MFLYKKACHLAHANFSVRASLFAKFSRASLSLIFLAVDQYLPFLNKAWSRKLVAANQFIPCNSRNIDAANNSWFTVFICYYCLMIIVKCCIYKQRTSLKVNDNIFCGSLCFTVVHNFNDLMAFMFGCVQESYMTGVIHMTPQFGQMLNPHVIPSTKEKRLIACLCK